jgi:hypothetical protein
MKYLNLLFLLIFCIATSGCAMLQSHPKKHIQINWNKPHKLYFQGKGAGAGMALMSTMGAMGMAIGVAIDEGISKDISKTQQKSGKSIEDILNDAAESTDLTILFNDNNNANNTPNINIERIEFKIVRGKNDATGVTIKALYTDNTGAESTLNYPKDIPYYIAPSFPLEQLKSNDKLANELLIEGFKQLLSSIK